MRGGLVQAAKGLALGVWGASRPPGGGAGGNAPCRGRGLAPAMRVQGPLAPGGVQGQRPWDVRSAGSRPRDVLISNL